MPDYIFVTTCDMFPVFGFPTLAQAAADEGWGEEDLTELFASEHDPWLRMWVTPGGGRIFQVEILND